jgi:hypothetical protein
VGFLVVRLGACRLRHHCQASMPIPASAAPRILLGANVSVRSRPLLFPNPNMMLPPLCLTPRGIATHLQATVGSSGGRDPQHKKLVAGSLEPCSCRSLRIRTRRLVARLSTRDSRLATLDSQLPAPSSQLPAPSSIQKLPPHSHESIGRPVRRVSRGRARSLARHAR